MRREIPVLPVGRNGVVTAPCSSLHAEGRTGLVAIGAEHAAIAGLGPHDCSATRAIPEEHTSVGRHGAHRRRPAHGATNRRRIGDVHTAGNLGDPERPTRVHQSADLLQLPHERHNVQAEAQVGFAALEGIPATNSDAPSPTKRARKLCRFNSGLHLTREVCTGSGPRRQLESLMRLTHQSGLIYLPHGNSCYPGYRASAQSAAGHG
jgi:hypothetical protein